MNLNRRVLLALTVAAVLLAAMSAATWRSLAASPREGEGPQGNAGVLAAAVPGGPGFVTQSGYLFKPVDPSYKWDYTRKGELYNPGDTAAGYAAPLSLPHGATVTKVVVWYYDILEANLTVTLERAHLDNNTYDTMASVASSGTAGYGYGEDESIDYAEIDLQSYAYYAYLTMPGLGSSDFTLVGIRVDYEYPGYVPLAMKNR
ncbi:MAG: hypothetical protein OEV76_13035 [Anaerolineae bacterium]|nr:hypothetical protein [Anaerolineae bacterium]